MAHGYSLLSPDEPSDFHARDFAQVEKRNFRQYSLIKLLLIFLIVAATVSLWVFPFLKLSDGYIPSDYGGFNPNRTIMAEVDCFLSKNTRPSDNVGPLSMEYGIQPSG